MRCSRVVLRIAVGHVATRLVAVGPSSPVGILVHSITGLQAPGTYLRAPSSRKKKHRSTTPVAHRLVREGTRHTRHNNVQRSADVNRHSGGGVGACGDASADNAHDSVQADGDAVAGAAVG
jgi:hypothetical protein